MKLIISTRAREDLRKLEEYIGTDNPQEAVDFVDAIIERCQPLTEFPYSGRKQDSYRAGYRSVTHGQYVIFYFVDGENVVLARVIHGNRDIRRALQQD